MAEGRTEDIGHLVVLFRGELEPVPGSPIEMSLILPAEISNDGAAEVICRKTIARTVAVANGESLPALATTISLCRLVRQ